MSLQVGGKKTIRGSSPNQSIQTDLNLDGGDLRSLPPGSHLSLRNDLNFGIRMLKTCCDRVVKQLSFLKTKHCLTNFLASLEIHKTDQQVRTFEKNEVLRTYPQNSSKSCRLLTLANLSFIKSRPLIVFSTSPPASKQSFRSESFCDLTLPTKLVRVD